jgi:poly(A) polymerase
MIILLNLEAIAFQERILSYPSIYLPEDHHIDPTLIDPLALSILSRLRDAGHIAYLVGGSVRDLLLNKTPKDYDISTSARPEQIKSIFNRQCILIGRRFRLAHIRFGHKIFEVSTFRSGENASELIVEDNLWGNESEDVQRRDFTINGLFYDSSNHSIIDYVNGWSDIQSGLLRTIGDPSVRFKQDPVRIIRLLKFNARFGFKIDSDTEKAAYDCKEEILKSSSARVLEEFFRMLESGSSAPFMRILHQYGLLPLLLPKLVLFLDEPEGKTIYHYLSSIDNLYHHKGKNILDRGILGACIIYPMLEKEIESQFLAKELTPHLGDISLLASDLIHSVLGDAFSHFPRRISSIINNLMVFQFRLTPLSGRRHYREKLFHHREFEMALLFLKIRALVNENLVETYISIRNQYRQMNKNTHKKSHHEPHRRES